MCDGCCGVGRGVVMEGRGVVLGGGCCDQAIHPHLCDHVTYPMMHFMSPPPPPVDRVSDTSITFAHFPTRTVIMRKLA